VIGVSFIDCHGEGYLFLRFLSVAASNLNRCVNPTISCGTVSVILVDFLPLVVLFWRQ
jgi:hypothetical protein